MALARVFIAASIDGYIAHADGTFGFLEPYAEAFDGWDAFFASIGSIVMGRTSYDQARTLDRWLYKDKPVAVLTSRPLGEAPPEGPPVHAIAEPSRAALDDLAARSPGDVWMFGGGLCLDAFARRGLIDRWEIFTVPVLLGDGIPLFPRVEAAPSTLTLTRLTQHPMGLIETHYEPTTQS